MKFWSAYRRDNTPQTHELTSFQYIGDEKNNEHLIRYYKRMFEQNHPGSDIQLAFSNVKAEIAKEPKTDKTSTASTLSTILKNRVVDSQKNILEKEDSDEDQFDDDDEESSSSNGDGFYTSKSIENEKKTKVAPVPYKIQTEQKKKEESLLKKPGNLESKKVIKANFVDEDADDDEDEEDEENEKVYFELNDKKKEKNENLKVAIEPIIPDPLRVREEINEIQPAYAKHNMLIAYDVCHFKFLL